MTRLWQVDREGQPGQRVTALSPSNVSKSDTHWFQGKLGGYESQYDIHPSLFTSFTMES